MLLIGVMNHAAFNTEPICEKKSNQMCDLNKVGKGPILRCR